MWDFLSGFLNELFPAFGADNGDLALAPGDTDGLLALRAGEVAMLPVLDPLQEHQKFPVFLVTLIGVAGEGTEDGPEHQAVGYNGENAAERATDEHTCHAYDQAGG